MTYLFCTQIPGYLYCSNHNRQLWTQNASYNLFGPLSLSHSITLGGRLQSTNLGSPLIPSIASGQHCLLQQLLQFPLLICICSHTKSERRASIFKKSSDGNDMVLRSNVKKINISASNSITKIQIHNRHNHKET